MACAPSGMSRAGVASAAPRAGVRVGLRCPVPRSAGLARLSPGDPSRPWSRPLPGPAGSRAPCSASALGSRSSHWSHVPLDQLQWPVPSLARDPEPLASLRVSLLALPPRPRDAPLLGRPPVEAGRAVGSLVDPFQVEDRPRPPSFLRTPVRPPSSGCHPCEAHHVPGSRAGALQVVGGS